MPKRSNRFQRLVTMLTATLAGKAKVTESAMLEDKVTNELREVDVLLELVAATYPISLGIEVISWARKADVTWVEKMRAKHENLSTNKLILVSESGFSDQAKKKAKFYEIDTLEIEDACGTDWDLLASLESVGTFIVTSINYSVKAVCKFENGLLEQLPISLNASFPTNRGHLSMDEMVREMLSNQEVIESLRANLKSEQEHDFWAKYTENNGLWDIEHCGSIGKIQELRIGLKVKESCSPVKFASGKFRSTPFVSGESLSGTDNLQFALARTQNGLIEGYLIDNSGIRPLNGNSL